MGGGRQVVSVGGGAVGGAKCGGDCRVWCGVGMW